MCSCFPNKFPLVKFLASRISSYSDLSFTMGTENNSQNNLNSTISSNSDNVVTSKPEISGSGTSLSKAVSKLFVNGPLLGSAELVKCLPRKEAQLQITTWNMGSLPLPSDNQLKSIFKDGDVDIHVVAIQESWPDTDASEILFQMCLGPGFVLFHSLAFGTLHLCIFIRRDLLWYTIEPTEVTHTVRAGRLFKTKGAVGIGFGLFGTKILVINAHLSAGEEMSRETQRIEELNKILLAHEVKRNHYDLIYIFGDLNFRIAGLGRDAIVEELRQNQFHRILMEDQLNKVLMKHNLCNLPDSLKGFSEAAAITFRPTYKYDIGTDNFDSSAKKRAPAYTDRILFKCLSEKNGFPPAICLKYESVPDLKVSDHRPVIGVFLVMLKPGYDTLPITGGKFKREVYVKAMQKRAKFLLDHRKQLASTACILS